MLRSKKVLAYIPKALFLLKAHGTAHVLARIFKKLYLKLEATSLWIDWQQLLSESPLTIDLTYQQWLNRQFPRSADLQKMAETIEIFRYKPTISVIMPVFNASEEFLKEAIDSVLNQIYPYWELCIADDASTYPHVKSVIEKYLSRDRRIKVIFRTQNGHISQSSNSALEIATGEFVSFLDHDDLLTPDALYEVALLLNKHPEADMIYSDETKLDEQGYLVSPAFKPEWCPDSFLSRMYTCHLGTYRRSLVSEVGGFRVGYEGSQDYDLVLRITERTNKIFHIPKILYYWRIHSTSTAIGEKDVKPYAYIAAQKAIEESLERRGEPGKVVEVPNFLGIYHIRYRLLHYRLVSVIIPAKSLDQAFVHKCLHSIFKKSTYPNYEILVISDFSIDDCDTFNRWETEQPKRFRHYQLSGTHPISALISYGVSQAQGEYLLFLDADTEVITSDWIEAMVEQAQRPSVGAVGGLLLYEDNTIQHAGLIMGVSAAVGCSHKYFPASSKGYMLQIQSINNFSAVSGACLMCRRELFETVGGFDSNLVRQYYDVDLCLKMVEKGYKNIYLPYVSLYHYEPKEHNISDSDLAYFRNKWKDFIQHDPCYSPHLTREYEDYRIGG